MEKMATELPLLVEMMAEITHEGPETTIGWCDDQTEFEFGSTYSSTASTVFVRSADNTRLVMSRTPTVRPAVAHGPSSSEPVAATEDSVKDK